MFADFKTVCIHVCVCGDEVFRTHSRCSVYTHTPDTLHGHNCRLCRFWTVWLWFPPWTLRCCMCVCSYMYACGMYVCKQIMYACIWSIRRLMKSSRVACISCRVHMHIHKYVRMHVHMTLRAHHQELLNRMYMHTHTFHVQLSTITHGTAALRTRF